MSFLHPWTALIAAAVVMPLLLLLYFLRLRRRTMRIASTLLWRRSFIDLQVNVPFQRLRMSALLVLQLLILVALLLAIAGPVIQAADQPASRIVLLIDHSASMNAKLTEEETRLDAAKRTAREMVGDLFSAGSEVRVMVIAFGRRANVVSGFDGRRAVINDAIDSIRPTDEQADLAAALRLADVFARQSEVESESTAPPDVVLVSDGCFAPSQDGRGFRLAAGRLRFVRLGLPPEDETLRNVGIVSFNARRDFNDPNRVRVFARLENCSSEPEPVVTTLRVGGEVVGLQEVEVPPAEGTARDALPGEATVTFTLDLPGGALLELSHGVDDDLATDNVAHHVLPEPREGRVLLVYGQDAEQADPFVADLLDAMDLGELRMMTAAAYDAGFGVDAVDGSDRLIETYDLLIFDRAPGLVLPGVPSISFGGVPAGVETIPTTEEVGRRVLSWSRSHPVLRHVSLASVVYAGFGALEVTTGGTRLATGAEGAIIAAIPARGVEHLVIGFELRRSNWPLDVSFAVFLQNAVDYLTLGRRGERSMSYRPGEPVTVRATPGVGQITVDGAIGATVTVEGESAVALPALSETGVYQVAGVLPPHERIAVSLLSGAESDLRGWRDLEVNAEAVSATGAASAVSRGVWWWFAAGALVLVVMEWIVYCRLMRR